MDLFQIDPSFVPIVKKAYLFILGCCGAWFNFFLEKVLILEETNLILDYLKSRKFIITNWIIIGGFISALCDPPQLLYGLIIGYSFQAFLEQYSRKTTKGDKTELDIFKLVHSIVDKTELESNNKLNKEPNDGSTEEPNDGSTEEPNDGSTEEPTDGSTEEPTDGTTEEPTDGTTEEPTDGTTEEPTDGTTEEPTDGTTEEPTDGSDEESNSSN